MGVWSLGDLDVRFEMTHRVTVCAGCELAGLNYLNGEFQYIGITFKTCQKKIHSVPPIYKRSVFISASKFLRNKYKCITFI